MKTTFFSSSNKACPITLAIFLLFISFINASAKVENLVSHQQQDPGFNQFGGVVIDSQSKEPLVFAGLTVVNTNISTITNSEGEFLIKIPNSIINAEILITTLGYHPKKILISQLKETNNRIEMLIAVTKLPEIVVNIPKDAKTLVISMYDKTRDNYSDDNILMNAFYRETIKKGQKNASLAEAIVHIYKQPYYSTLNDRVKLYKTRKSTDYSKLDTIALKLEGGPFNTLFLDMMKYPDYIFNEETFDLYDFHFDPSTSINERTVYVVRFKQKESIKEPLYYGKLFIDAKTRALTSAIYNLNVANKEEASKIFVKRKPKDILVYPTAVSYRVDYKEKDGVWYYSYGNVQMSLKVNKKNKLFNSIYTVNSEMATTDWKINTNDEKIANKNFMQQSIVISDEASGFSDPEFWGAYNVIEPEKSIEAAIKKIQKNLD